jgi:hypothetical protein
VPIDRRKYRERHARIAAFLERSRELIGRSGAVRRHAVTAAARATATAIALADDERKRALQRATAALKAIQAESAASSAVDVDAGRAPSD